MSSTSRSRPRAEVRRRVPSRKAPAQVDVSALDTHLGYWLRAVSNHVSQAFRARVERHGVTVAEWAVLRALYDGNGSKPSELAARLGLSRGAVSKLVSRLVAKDLLEVSGDEHDGRAQRVNLKAGGRRLVPKLAAAADENDATAFGRLDADQRSALLATLQALARQLDIRATPLE